MKCKWFTRLSTRPQNAAFGWNDFIAYEREKLVWFRFEFQLFDIQYFFPLCFSHVLCHFGIIFLSFQYFILFFARISLKFFPNEPFLCICFGQILTIFPSIPSIFFFTDSCSVISFLNFDFFFRCSHIQIFDTIRCYKMNERCSLSRDNIEIHVLCG